MKVQWLRTQTVKTLHELVVSVRTLQGSSKFPECEGTLIERGKVQNIVLISPVQVP